jgi:hypothetical protein
MIWQCVVQRLLGALVLFEPLFRITVDSGASFDRVLRFSTVDYSTNNAPRPQQYVAALRKGDRPDKLTHVTT